MNREPVAGTISGQGSVGAEVRKEPICFSQSCMYSLPGKRPSGLMSGGGLLPLWGMPKKRGMPFRGGWFSIRFGGCQSLGNGFRATGFAEGAGVLAAWSGERLSSGQVGRSPGFRLAGFHRVFREWIRNDEVGSLCVGFGSGGQVGNFPELCRVGVPKWSGNGFLTVCPESSNVVFLVKEVLLRRSGKTVREGFGKDRFPRRKDK